MNPHGELQEVLVEGRTLRQVGEGIYSVLPDAAHEHLYDRRASLYDAVVSTWIYNRLMWGTSPRDYEEFARRAHASHASGRILDAGCGSLLFTARAHVEARRPVVAFDQSLRMLERARARLLKLAGRVPRHITLLQADLSDLPFRPASFSTVVCLNVLHQYADAPGLIANLERLLDDVGRLFMTSLVTNERTVGDFYLNALFKAGEFVRPRSSAEVRALLDSSLGRRVEYSTRGNMAYATTSIRHREVTR